MTYFNKDNFDNEMQIVKRILEEKGYVLESDHPYAYSMQRKGAFNDVVEWLEKHGYYGRLNRMGLFEGVAVYALYDEEKVTYYDMRLELYEEARRQMGDD